MRKILKSPVLEGATNKLLMVGNAALLATVAMYAFVYIKPQDSAIPLRYSTIFGQLELGRWHNAFSLVAFAVIVTIINISIAHTLATYQLDGKQPQPWWVGRVLLLNVFLLLTTLYILRAIVRLI